MSSTSRNTALAILVFALGAGFLVAGHYLYKLPIGLDATAFLAGEKIQKLVLVFVPDLTETAAGGVLLLLSLLGIAAVSFIAMRRTLRSQVDPARRRFLTGAGSGAGMALASAVVASAAAAARGLLGLGQGGHGWLSVGHNISAEVQRTSPEWLSEWKDSRIQDYRRFGRTRWQVSDIVLGTGQIRGEEGEQIARLAIERGVNYFDTSPDYSGAGSENAMGRAIRALGNRDRMFIATKFCTPRGHLPPGTSVAGYKQAVEGSLSRLGTDYVDLCHIHSCDEVERLMDPNVHEAFDRLKQEGKVRFLGFSSHTPNLVEVADRAIGSGRFDVMMLAYHFGQWAQLGGIIQRARAQQDMGVVAMKTLKGAKHRGLAGFGGERDAFSQAALKWALSNPDVSCAVISFFQLQHVDEYLFASGKHVTAADRALLEKYDRLIAGSYCAPHCGVCLDSCPEQLAIDDILRQRMYFEDYGWQKEGMRLYAQLERHASVCVSCSAPCAGSCPSGIDIRARVAGAHELLSLA